MRLLIGGVEVGYPEHRHARCDNCVRDGSAILERPHCHLICDKEHLTSYFTALDSREAYEPWESLTVLPYGDLSKQDAGRDPALRRRPAAGTDPL